MSLMSASDRDESFASVAARLRDGVHRLREFPQDHRYAPAPATPTREDAHAALAALARGATAERLLERIASREDAEALRALVLEVGAAALVKGAATGSGGCGAAHEVGDGAAGSPRHTPAGGYSSAAPPPLLESR